MAGQYVVGIDLGTSHSVVASARHGETPVLFPIPQRTGAGEREARVLFPSCAYAFVEGEITVDDALGESSGFTVGAFAKKRSVEVPHRSIVSAKSWLCHARVDRMAPILPWGETEGPKLSPVEASTMFLGQIRRAWDAAHPDAPLSDQRVILTVPASFDDAARELTVLAAKRAALTVRLLEEPQAAYYAWQRGPHGRDDEAAVLVVDVGGGTTDLSLLERDDSGAMKRVAVGPHLLLGGDNMDLALSHALEPRLLGDSRDKLEPISFAELTLRARDAKELLLAHGETRSEVTVAIAGRGSQLLRASRSTKLTREDVERIVLEGFFPTVDLAKRPPRSALVAFGLPYERDVAITRHVATFVSRHLQQKRLSAVLFNGGVFRAEVIRARLLSSLASLGFGEPLCLEGDEPDTAVAIGAVHYGLAQEGGGPLIGSGASRAYFLGLGRASASDPARAMCIVPRGTNESAIQKTTTDPPLLLALGEAVRFPLFTFDETFEHRVGDIVVVDERFEAAPALVTTLSGEAKARVPVAIESELTPVGTVDVSCVEIGDSSRRHRLAFDLRAPVTIAGTSEPPPRSLRRLDEPRAAIHQVFGKGASTERDAKQLVRELERLLGARDTWALDTLRALGDALLDLGKGRRKSLEHERAYYLLTGYCLRPGFGAAKDGERATRLLAIAEQRLAFPAETRTWQQYFIALRRISGGLDEAQSAKLRDEFDAFIAPTDAKLKRRGQAPTSLGDLVDLLARLERVPEPRKVALANWLVDRALADPEPRLREAVGRIGARIPAYATIDTVVSTSHVERWVDLLLRGKTEPMVLARVLTALCRMTGDRGRDVSESCRREVLRRLEKERVPEPLVRPIREFVATAESERSDWLGDSLPIGLVLPAS